MRSHLCSRFPRPRRALTLVLSCLALFAAAPPVVHAQDAATVQKVRDLVLKGHQHYQDGEFKKATKAYEKADQIAGGRAAAALSGLTRSAIEQGDFAAAAEFAGRWKAAASSPQVRARALYFEGLSHNQQGVAARLAGDDDGHASFERAVESLRGSLATADDAETRPLAALRLVDALADLDQMAAAEQVLADHAELFGDNPYAAQMRCFVGALRDAPVQAAATTEAQPAEQPQKPVAKLIQAPQVEWPEDGPRGLAGTIVLEAAISAEGKVECVRVISGLPHGMTEAAVAALSEASFEPARLDDRAVASRQLRSLVVSVETRARSTRSPFNQSGTG